MTTLILQPEMISEEIRMMGTVAPKLDISQLVETFYADYYSRIHRYFSSRIFDKGYAEDLSQTVFLKIFASLQKGLWEGEGGIHYIFTVARNTLIDYYRRAKREPIVSDEIVSQLSDSLPTSDLVESRQQKESILASMKNLRPNQKEAITLRYFCDMGYPEIAKIMGKRSDGVRQLVHRGLASMKVVLQPAY